METQAAVFPLFAPKTKPEPSNTNSETVTMDKPEPPILKPNPFSLSKQKVIRELELLKWDDPNVCKWAKKRSDGTSENINDMRGRLEGLWQTKGIPYESYDADKDLSVNRNAIRGATKASASKKPIAKTSAGAENVGFKKSPYKPKPVCMLGMELYSEDAGDTWMSTDPPVDPAVIYPDFERQEEIEVKHLTTWTTGKIQELYSSNQATVVLNGNFYKGITLLVHFNQCRKAGGEEAQKKAIEEKQAKKLAKQKAKEAKKLAAPTVKSERDRENKEGEEGEENEDGKPPNSAADSKSGGDVDLDDSDTEEDI